MKNKNVHWNGVDGTSGVLDHPFNSKVTFL